MIKKSSLIRNVSLKLSLIFSDYWLAYFRFLQKHRYFPRFRHPRSLSEKINYIKLYNRNPVRKKITDRVEVRDFVNAKTPDLMFPRLYWYGLDLTEDQYHRLPEKFVLKANHGSGMVEVVKKSDYSYSDLVNIINDWLKVDYSKFGREWFYRDLEKYVLAEEFLQVDKDAPPDYKFFVVCGKVEFVQVDLSRFSDHRRNILDREGRLLPVTLLYDNNPSFVNIPEGFEKAISFSETLGREFDLIRVDLYIVDGIVYFGELTNAPENGFGKFSDKNFDFQVGGKLPMFVDR